MRVSALIPLVAAVLPATASAAGTLGFSLGNKNPDSSCKQTIDYVKDFRALKGVSTLVRTYSASDCNTAKNIIPAAKSEGFKVVLGVWPDYDQSFDQDFAVLKSEVPGNEDVVHSITVGSECLYRGSLSAQKLLSRIQQVQKQFPSLEIGTADSWNKFADGTADPLIQGGVTYFLANGFAYWQGQKIGNATDTYFDDMSQSLNHIQQVAGPNKNKIHFATGETGWPTTGGSNYGPAIASTQNAEEYHKKAVCGALTWGIDVFYFEAFDETWKPKSTGDNGQQMDETHWGMFNDKRVPKFDTSCPKN